MQWPGNHSDCRRHDSGTGEAEAGLSVVVPCCAKEQSPLAQRRVLAFEWLYSQSLSA